MFLFSASNGVRQNISFLTAFFMVLLSWLLSNQQESQVSCQLLTAYNITVIAVSNNCTQQHYENNWNEPFQF